MQEWTNWHSAVSNGNPAEEEEGSQEGSVDSAEYVSDSGEMEEETERRRRRLGSRARHLHHQSLELSAVTNPRLRRLLQQLRMLRQPLLWLPVLGA